MDQGLKRHWGKRNVVKKSLIFFGTIRYKSSFFDGIFIKLMLEWQKKSPEHVYYRWKMYSLLQGDAVNHWRMEPFKMFDEGSQWVPPRIPFMDKVQQSAFINLYPTYLTLYFFKEGGILRER
jgi:hypothetical protein